MKRSCTTLLFASALLPLMLACTSSDVPIGGNSTTTTQAGPAMLAGSLREPDGKTPAAGAVVRLHSPNLQADTTGAGSLDRKAQRVMAGKVTGFMGKKAAGPATATAFTDANGNYTIDTIDTGIYVLEGTDGNGNELLRDSVRIAQTDSVQNLGVDTLLPAGTITGVVRLSEGGDSRLVRVLAYGIDRFATVDTNGIFTFSYLAKGKYNLRLFSGLANYLALDTANVFVWPADTTYLDTISLPFTGIPIPQKVAASCDTPNCTVTVRWNKCDTALVSGCNVYRKLDSTGQFVLVNATPLTDSFFVDSLGNGLSKGLTYTYCVVALDKNNTPGDSSPRVTAVVAYYVDAGRDTTVGQGDTVVLRGRVNTNAITPASFSWDANGDGIADLTDTTVATVDTLLWTYPDVGQHRAIFSVTTIDNMVYTDTVVITVVPADTAATH